MSSTTRRFPLVESMVVSPLLLQIAVLVVLDFNVAAALASIPVFLAEEMSLLILKGGSDCHVEEVLS